jgi:uncharacterized membrane protein YozB (DUF420 family)
MAAGVSVAYVFVDFLPLMSQRERAFLQAVHDVRLLSPQFRIYIAALVGFVVFYGLRYIVTSVESDGATAADPAAEPPFTVARLLHVAGFAIYNLMMGYLLIEWSHEPIGLALYCGALGLHFLIADEGMQREYGERHDRWRRWMMAGWVMAGAMLAAVTSISVGALAVVVGFVAGGVVINSVKGEMPSEREGRFIPFMIGSFAYAFLIVCASKLEGG